MKVLIFFLGILFLLSGCSTDSDPAPKCTTKAITYKEFKDNYKPEKQSANPNTQKKQNFLFDGKIGGTEAKNK